MKRKSVVQVGLLLAVVSVVSVLWLKQQTVTDWIKLRGYVPAPTVSALAVDDTMTPAALHLFYVNRPRILSGSAFSNVCPKGGEQTVVLGCYVGDDRGIYLYQVTDGRLQGVEQVTAAHEMLHAAYRRLSNTERTQIDSWLEDYYAHGLTDERIKNTLDAYRKTEPNDVVNEMHSIFGTEVADLPPQLENYYKRYFTNRTVVADYTARYQGEFTSRQSQVGAYDAQLTAIKQQITANQATLERQKTNLNTQREQLQAKQDGGDIAGYNAGVSSYNAAVAAYNQLLAATKDLVAQYNDIVVKRNAVVVEERQLTQALSADAIGK